MLKIIKLDIDENLSGDTRVEEIALVLEPAVEVDFVYFGKENFESYDDYPHQARTAACRARKFYTEEGNPNDCLTAVGVARMNQLCKREPISEKTIARMASFARHLGGENIPYEEGCQGLAVDAWGGRKGIEWAQEKLKEIRRKKENGTR
jgi:hypothetical protein